MRLSDTGKRVPFVAEAATATVAAASQGLDLQCGLQDLASFEVDRSKTAYHATSHHDHHVFQVTIPHIAMLSISQHSQQMPMSYAW